jgi:hypothetical protein
MTNRLRYEGMHERYDDTERNINNAAFLTVVCNNVAIASLGRNTLSAFSQAVSAVLADNGPEVVSHQRRKQLSDEIESGVYTGNYGTTQGAS